MAGTSLSKKLGVRAGHQMILLGAPERLAVSLEREMEEGEVKVSRQMRPAPVDCFVLFLDRLTDLEDRIVDVTERLHPDGQVWVAWRSKRAADVGEDVVRRIGMTAGMVDTKTCAIDRVWSGMRLQIRRENRDALQYRTDGRRTKRATRPPTFASGAGSGLATARARKRA